MKIDRKRLIIEIISIVIIILILILTLNFIDNKVIVNRDEYDDLLTSKELLDSIDDALIESTNISELSTFEQTSIEVGKQFDSKDLILLYKSFINEENRTANYYIVYKDIDGNYVRNKNAIQNYINKLSLSVYKEWSLWGYGDMTVTIFVEGESKEYVYFNSINGHTDFANGVKEY